MREGKDKMYFGAHIRYTPKGKSGPCHQYNAEVFKDFPKLWALMQERAAKRIQEPEKDCPPKRQSMEVEAQVCREQGLYRKCSRNCAPRKFGGCKGWTKWGSCPQPEPEDEG